MARSIYEIQRYSGGRWVLDNVAGDRDAAISLAKSTVATSRGPVSVRVMSVQQHEDGHYSEVTVFRSTPVDGHNAEAQLRRLKADDEVQAFREQLSAERGAEREARPEPIDDAAALPARRFNRLQDTMLSLLVSLAVGVAVTLIHMLRIVVSR